MSHVSFEELSEVIGVGAAAALCDEHGGTTITVPGRQRASHPIVRTVGAEAAKKLHAYYGPGRLSLPLGPTRGEAGRRAHAARLIEMGYSVAEAARLADVHERTVWRTKARVRDIDAPLLDQIPEPHRGGARKLTEG